MSQQHSKSSSSDVARTSDKAFGSLSSTISPQQHYKPSAALSRFCTMPAVQIQAAKDTTVSASFTATSAHRSHRRRKQPRHTPPHIQQHLTEVGPAGSDQPTVNAQGHAYQVHPRPQFSGSQDSTQAPQQTQGLRQNYTTQYYRHPDDSNQRHRTGKGNSHSRKKNSDLALRSRISGGPRNCTPSHSGQADPNILALIGDRSGSTNQHKGSSDPDIRILLGNGGGKTYHHNEVDEREFLKFTKGVTPSITKATTLNSASSLRGVTPSITKTTTLNSPSSRREDRAP
ncbi:hypothetical protein BU23DRAFT_569828 [Bimuria novae-zelandiae CBS 107.79]|uniref:Uncharacterized protein n=1 Tax=Bimuria novae-zelandiae CBS 107.79 TaxID=1447943 RepID=A0A6A5V5X7_9PLEO|nr:hypothetical protein BU23DRAFT_569828 [Bimuria novae-zelandiae CBS 107.79]